MIRKSKKAQGNRSGPIVQEREEQVFASRWGLVGPDRFLHRLPVGLGREEAAPNSSRWPRTPRRACSSAPRVRHDGQLHRLRELSAEAILVQAARLLNDLDELWARATDDERTEIAQNLFAGLRVRDGMIASAKLARDEYLPLIASAEARVWMARPEGSQRAVQTLRVEGVEELVRALRAA